MTAENFNFTEAVTLKLNTQDIYKEKKKGNVFSIIFLTHSQGKLKHVEEQNHF